jgi:hypothetical protein
MSSKNNHLCLQLPLYQQIRAKGLLLQQVRDEMVQNLSVYARTPLRGERTSVTAGLVVDEDPLPHQLDVTAKMKSHKSIFQP